MGSISLEHKETITKFGENSMLKKIVVNYIQHLTNFQHLTYFQLGKEVRSRQRAEEKSQRQDKRYDEYNWLDLVVQGKLNELKVLEVPRQKQIEQAWKKG